MARRASIPSSVLLMGTPITGNVVLAAMTPGRCAAMPAAAIITLMPRSFAPLAKIKMPVHEVAMMMSITLRFIPILTEELDKITKAQLARGADFEEGNLFHRMKGYVPILVPLFVAAIRRANDLALAMESRCYQGGQSRTKMKPLQYKKRDAIAYAIIFTYLGVMIVGAFL